MDCKKLILLFLFQGCEVRSLNNQEVCAGDVGRRIRKIRFELGMTMSQFANEIDQAAKSGTVSNWETGKNLPNRVRTKRIAALGNTTIDFILYGSSKSKT